MILLLLILNFSLYANEIDEVKATQTDFKQRSQRILKEINNIIKDKFNTQKEKITSNAKKNETKTDNDKLIIKNIKALEDYLNKYPKSKDKGDIIYQLAILYYEVESNKYLKASEKFETLLEQGITNTAPPSPDYSKATNTFKLFTKNYPQNRNLEDAYYQLSQIYREIDNPELEIKYLKLIIKKFPKSLKVPELAFRIAEYYFDIGRNTNAALYYSFVLSFSQSDYYENALYKIAWAYYRNRKTTESVNSFMNYIKYKQNTDPKSSLIKEALDKISKSFADVEWLPNRVHKTLTKINAQNSEFSILQGLCKTYAKASLLKISKQCVKQTVKLHPYNPKLPLLYQVYINAIEKNMYSTKSKNRMPININVLLNLFGSNSKWRAKNKKDIEANKDADLILEKYILKTAIIYQKKGEKTKLVKYYRKAQKLYEEFIKTHKESPYLSLARLNYAKILFLLEKYALANKKYLEVAKDLYTVNKEGSASTYYEGIVSFKMLIMQKDKKYKKRIKISAKQTLLSKLEQKHIKLCEIFLNKYENIKDNQIVCNVIYEKGEILMRNAHLKDAINSYNKILNICPDTSIFVDSLKNLTTIYNWKKDFKKVQELAIKIMKSKKFLKKKEKSHYKNLLNGALFKSAQNLENSGDVFGAAKEYIKIAKRHSKSKFASSALFNAAVIYLDNNKPKEAEKSAKILIKKHKRDPLVAKLAFKMAVLKEESLDLPRAIYYYKLSAKSKKFKKASLYSLYLLYGAQKQTNKSIFYLLKHKNNKQNIIKALALLQKAGHKKIFMKLSKKLKRNTPSNLILQKNLYAYKLTHNHRYLNKIQKMGLKYPKKLREDIKYELSKINMKRINKLYKQFNKIKITEQNVSKSKLFFARKEKYMNKITKKLNKIIKLSDPLFSLQAIYINGVILHNFYKFITNSPIPNTLSDKEKEQYKIQIQALAAPYKEQANKLYQTIIKTSNDLANKSIWYIKAQKSQKDLKEDIDAEYTLIPKYIFVME